MNFDVKHFVLSHLIWIVAVAIALIAIHSWIGEHDARLLAAQQVKISDQRVKDLEQQVAASDAQAAQTIAALKQRAKQVTTAPQAIAAIPDVSSLHTTVSTQDPAKLVVDPVELYTTLNQCAQDKTALDACQVARTTKDAQLTEKDTEIKALKQPKSFWARTKTTLKIIGVGIGIGIVLGGHL